MKNKPAFKSQDHRHEKLAEHEILESRRHIRDKKYYVIDDDDTIDQLLANEHEKVNLRG